jgi:carbon starvation protein
LAWLVTITMTAGWQKLFSPDPRIGFLSHANGLQATLDAGNLPRGAASVDVAQRMIFNDRLDAAVAAFFMISVVVVLVASIHEWMQIIRGTKPAVSTEIPFTAAPIPPIGSRAASVGARG